LSFFFEFIPSEGTTHPPQSNLILDVGEDFVDVWKSSFVIRMII